MPHRSHEELEKNLSLAEMQVKVGGIYAHYKNPEHKVRVIRLGIQEATEKICVIYQDVANERLIFVRDLDSWLEKPLENTPRFKLVDN